MRGKVIDELLPPGGDAKPVKATITVRATDSVEMLNTQCNRALLEQVAQMTGGQVIPPTAIGEVLELVSFTPEVSETNPAHAAVESLVEPVHCVRMLVYGVGGAEGEGVGVIADC